MLDIHLDMADPLENNAPSDLPPDLFDPLHPPNALIFDPPPLEVFPRSHDFEEKHNVASPPTSLIHNVSEISSVIDSNLCLENDGDASQNDIVASLSSKNSFVLPQGVSPPAPPVNGAPIDPANIVQHPRVRRSTALVSSSPNNPNLALL